MKTSLHADIKVGDLVKEKPRRRIIGNTYADVDNPRTGLVVDVGFTYLKIEWLNGDVDWGGTIISDVTKITGETT